MKKIMEDDAAAVSYRIDEEGEFELDDEGEQIEQARSSWYSPEWRRHYEYALTDAQRTKLLQIIENLLVDIKVITLALGIKVGKDDAELCGALAGHLFRERIL